MPVQTLHNRIVVPSTDKLSEVQEVWCGPSYTRLLAFLCGCVWNCLETRVPCMPFPFFNMLLTRCCHCNLILWSACWEEHRRADWASGEQGTEVLRCSSHFLRLFQPLVLMQCELPSLLTRGGGVREGTHPTPSAQHLSPFCDLFFHRGESWVKEKKLSNQMFRKC